jgi:hypothetical protein
VQPTSDGDFVDLITHGQPAAPSYCSVDAQVLRVSPHVDSHRGFGVFAAALAEATELMS